MTLILGYASDEFAIIASDRLVTWDGGGSFTERTNKTTYFAGQLLLGYSGVADLGEGQRETEIWLLHTLLPLSADRTRDWRGPFSEQVAAELTRQARPPKDSWFALLIVGFRRSWKTGELFPVLETVSNDREPATLHPARIDPNPGNFKLVAPTVNPSRHAFRLWAIGQTPSMEQMRELDDAIARYVRRHPTHSREIARALARCIVARSEALGGAGVGQSVQVTVMPKRAVGVEGYAMEEFVEPLEGVAAIHFNPPVRADGSAVLYGPNIVGADFLQWDCASSFGSVEEIGPREPFVSPGN